MQCIILAAGNGTRLRPLTDTIPKPLVTVCGTALIDHVVSALPDVINELIIVIGYKGDMIKSHCGTIFYGRSITYIEQTRLQGTAMALWLCKDHIKEKFLLMFADDIHGKDDLTELVSHKRSILSAHSDHPERFGVLTCDANNILTEFVEKPERPQSHTVATGPMVLDRQIFEFPPITSVNGEYFLPDVIMQYKNQYPITVTPGSTWIPIGYPADIKTAEDILCPPV